MKPTQIVNQVIKRTFVLRWHLLISGFRVRGDKPAEPSPPHTYIKAELEFGAGVHPISVTQETLRGRFSLKCTECKGTQVFQ